MELLADALAFQQRGIQHQQSMKIRPSICLFIIVALVLIALILRHGMKKPVETPPAASVETNLTSPAATASGTSTGLPPQTIPERIATNTTIPPSDKGEQIKEGLAVLNDTPIAFYGKLEDQFGNAVSGAQVAASVRIYNGVQSTVDRFATMSDGNGYFQINHGNGESLSVVPSKTGYVRAMSSTSYNYSYMYPDHFTPDPNNPTVIKMWKLQGAEQLVDISKEYKLPFTNTPIFFDLVAGGVVPIGGDLQVVITRTSGPLSKKNPGDWSIDLKSISGGIIESDFRTSQITFEAPTDGYQDNYLVQMNHDDPAWYDNIHKVFFLKSRGGQVYAKFNLDFMINLEADGLMDFQFKGVANTNSSRNWEATAPQ